MKTADFTVQLIRDNPHAKYTQRWQAGQITAAMAGCSVHRIVRVLTAFEEDRSAGVVDPARWLILFAGLENARATEKAWLRIVHGGEVVDSASSFRQLLLGSGK